MKYFIQIIVLFFLTMPFLCAENLTLTTYYPAPAGSYAKLKTFNMCIGTDCTGKVVPNGQLYIQGGLQIGATVLGSNAFSVTGDAVITGSLTIGNELRLTPHAVVPVCDATHVGLMYFDSAAETPRVCKSTGWADVGGGAGGVPTGAIIMWSDPTLPSGWQLCDGTGGTPDLRDRFIVGTGTSYVLGNTGGAATVVLTTPQMPAHTHLGAATATGTTGSSGDHGHTLSLPMGKFDVSKGKDGTAWSQWNGKPGTSSNGSHSHNIASINITGIASAGGGLAHENRPPYYALSYICKQ